MAIEQLLPAGAHMVGVTVKGNRYNLTVDGSPFTTFQHGAASAWFGVEEDFSFGIDGVQYVLVVRRRVMRLVANGRYLDNGQPFIPARHTPKWLWVFLVLDILVAVVSLGGALPILISLGAIALSAVIARSRMRSTLAKVLLCVLVTLAAWGLWILLIGGVALLQAM